jgi:hypothetical protein
MQVATNELEQLVVIEEMRKKGYTDYTIKPGNDCVWVSVPIGSFSLEMYYIFQDGRLVDVQID